MECELDTVAQDPPLLIILKGSSELNFTLRISVITKFIMRRNRGNKINESKILVTTFLGFSSHRIMMEHGLVFEDRRNLSLNPYCLLIPI